MAWTTLTKDEDWSLEERRKIRCDTSGASDSSEKSVGDLLSALWIQSDALRKNILSWFFFLCLIGNYQQRMFLTCFDEK